MYNSIKQTWELIHKLERQGFRKIDILTTLHKVTREYTEGKRGEFE